MDEGRALFVTLTQTCKVLTLNRMSIISKRQKRKQNNPERLFLMYMEKIR